MLNLLRRPRKTVLFFLALYLYFHNSYGQLSSASCNTFSPLVGPGFGSLTPGTNNFSNASRLTDADLANFADWSYLIGGNAYIEVKDNNATGANIYPAGTFAGFVVDATAISLLANTTITTYSGTTTQESISGGSLVTLDLLNGKGRIGINATKSFDRIRISYAALGVVGNMKVYYAVVEKLCAGPALVCNTPVLPYAPLYPVAINTARTGISGVACALCSVNGSDNIIDNDTSTNATITLTAGLLVSGSISVVDGFTTYPAGTYAAFDIANPNLIGANLFTGITVSTYLNGVLVESKTGSSQLVSAASSLFNGVGNQRVGLVATALFNEVRLTLNQTAALNLGSTVVHDVVLEKLCAGTLPDCASITSFTPAAYPNRNRQCINRRVGRCLCSLPGK